MLEDKLANKEERLWSLFQQIDTNNDGLISVSELNEALGITNGKKLVAGVDANNDGHVDYDEFTTLWRCSAQRQRRSRLRRPSRIPILKARMGSTLGPLTPQASTPPPPGIPGFRLSAQHVMTPSSARSTALRGSNNPLVYQSNTMGRVWRGGSISTPAVRGGSRLTSPSPREALYFGTKPAASRLASTPDSRRRRIRIVKRSKSCDVGTIQEEET